MVFYFKRSAVFVKILICNHSKYIKGTYIVLTNCILITIAMLGWKNFPLPFKVFLDGLLIKLI